MRRASLSLALGLSCALVFIAGCKNGERKGSTENAAAVAAVGAVTVVVRAGDREVPFRVEVVRTPAEREKGLMYRDRMDQDAGMLFIFESDLPLTFWMKNTFIPLDMIFIDSGMKIVGIVENAAPGTLTSRSPGVPAQYVLEINGGLAAKLGLRAGTSVQFRNLSGR